MEEESVESPRPGRDEHRVTILRKAFDVYDADGSGSIDYSEFKRLIEDLGWPTHEEFIDRAVRVLDQDLSGAIEFAEFQKWTEFAYASRILYRQEMYGLGPRSSSVDGVDMQPVVDEAHDGKKALVIRRVSLTTVFEEKEHAEQETQRNDDAAGESSEEEEEENESDRSEVKFCPELRFCSSGSSNARDQDREVTPSSPFFLKLRNRKSSPHIPCREVDFGRVDFLTRRERSIDGTSEREKEELSERNKKMQLDGDNTSPTRNFDTPIREMATMVLSTGRRSRRIHTSQARAKSVGILRSRRSGRFRAGSYMGEEKSDPSRLGPRTESKMTVRMRFACGQFEGKEAEKEEACSSRSQNIDESGSESGDEIRLDELLKMSKEAISSKDEGGSSRNCGASSGGGRDRGDGTEQGKEPRKDGGGDEENKGTE